MAGFETFLHTLWNRYPDPRKRGLEFERVCRWFLQNNPVYAGQLVEVWHWQDWPDRWAAEDTGIDLVAKGVDGVLWAIQAKCYEPETVLTKSALDSFLAEAANPVFGYSLVIATTHELNHKARRTMTATGVGYLLHSGLSQAHIPWADYWSTTAVAPRMKKSPRPHQIEAIEAVCAGFERQDRGQLIMACGTGKTLTSLWIHEKLQSRRTLFLLPSLSLMKQTLEEWAEERRRMFEFLAVCSDETVGRQEDEPVADAAALAIPVTTDATAIAAFLRRQDEDLVVFCTYQSSPRLADVFAAKPYMQPFDLVIADEAHRCVGQLSAGYGVVLDQVQLPAKRRLFMTATPRVASAGIQKKARELDFEVASMDNVATFGPEFHRLTFGRAIESQLLTDYQVLIVGVTDAQVKEWTETRAFVTRDGETVESASDLAGQVALLKAMREHDLRRVITFHSRVERAKNFSQALPLVNHWLKADIQLQGVLHSEHVSGVMTAGRRSQALMKLRNVATGHHSVLSNARCLSEGVDVPSIDGIAFVDPRRSQVDVVQAVGRAIRLSEGKKIGTIVLALFVDEGAELEAQLESSGFAAIGQVLRALRDHDETLAGELDGMRIALGRSNGRGGAIPSRLVFDLPSALVGTAFADAIRLETLRLASETWMEMYGRLIAYADQVGHARPPANLTVGDVALGAWVSAQRVAYKQKRPSMTPERRTRLESLPGWAWDGQDALWEQNYDALRTFVAREGHARVPMSHHEDGVALGRWVCNQRHARNGTGPWADSFFAYQEDHRLRLEALPKWTWDPHRDKWLEAYSELKALAETSNLSTLPAHFVTSSGFKAGSWMYSQRARRSKGEIAEYQVELMEALPGWTWDEQRRHAKQQAKQQAWAECLAAVARYVRDNGSLPTPGDDGSGRLKLAGWIVKQRQRYRQRTMLLEEQKALEQVPGWTWEPRQTQFLEGLSKYKRYVERVGSAIIAQSYVDEDGYRLGGWVAERVTAGRNGSLPQEQRLELEALGWSDLPADDLEFDMRVQSLRTFFEDCPGKKIVWSDVDKQGYKLGQWAYNQRRKYRLGTLPPERVRLLNEVEGWTWR